MRTPTDQTTQAVLRKNGVIYVADARWQMAFVVREAPDAQMLECNCSEYGDAHDCEHVRCAAQLLEDTPTTAMTRRGRVLWWNTYIDPHRKQIRVARRAGKPTLEAIYEGAQPCR